MFTAGIISPHRDDAAFSCGLTISALLENAVGVKIINCFTVSQYAPYRPDLTRDPQSSTHLVSELRAREDATFAALLPREIIWTDLNRLDAPLRLHSASTSVCDVHDFTDDDLLEISALSILLEEQLNVDYVLLPLAIGDHIDHRLTNEAALAAVGDRPFGFYEDLPYAARYDYAITVERVQCMEQRLGHKLASQILHMPDSRAIKKRFASVYDSQVDSFEIDQIANFSETYGGEQIWIKDGEFLLGSQADGRR